MSHRALIISVFPVQCENPEIIGRTLTAYFLHWESQNNFSARDMPGHKLELIN